MATKTQSASKESFSDTKVVMEIPRRQGKEKLVIGTRDYKGKKYVEQRIWFTTDGTKFLPSKKGIIVGISEIKDIVSGLCTIAEQEGVTVEAKS